MPNYDYKCEAGHVFEHRCSIADKPVTLPCPTQGEEGPCGLPAKFIITQMSSINDTEVMILDYPGSRRLKAGYVHAYVDPGVKKVSSGPGGMLNPRTNATHPAAQWVQPEWKAARKP